MKRKRSDSLLFKFAIIFILFIILTTAINGYATYKVQYNIYKEQCQGRVQDVSHYLASLIESDGEEFLVFRDYIIEHRDELELPADFSTDYLDNQYSYDKLLAEKYPSKALQYDLTFDELDDETLEALAIYNYVYWTGIFEQAREDFDIIYTYLMYPSDEELHMYYIIDGVRTSDENGNLIFADDVYEAADAHEKMWEAWNTGNEPDGFDEYDNEYGKTYAFYSPIYINGEKAGVIGAEVEVEQFNSALLGDAFKQMSVIAIATILMTIGVLILIDVRYIRKLSALQSNVEEYATNKNPKVANIIRDNSKGRDEIASLSQQVADMIDSIEEHLENLFKTSKELDDAKAKAQTLGEQVTRDALTGIRNKLAYDNEVQNLEWRIAQEKFAEFGIAMIDLNYLKRINDTFGHEKGNVAIQTICRIVCTTFKHSPVFRIGGDEFVVILENDDFENVDSLVEQFHDTLREIEMQDGLEPWERVSAAIGWTLYNPEIDNTISNVFKRADELMYENKKAMRANRD